MLRSLMKGVGLGAGMSIGQEITRTIIQNLRNRGQGNQGAAGQATWDIQCGRCNEVNTGDSRFCGSCGNQLVSRCNLSSGTRCNCGYVNAQGQRFCSECGSQL